MKQISIYFGKQQDSVLGSYADIVKLHPVSNEEADIIISALLCEDNNWLSLNQKNGVKFINISKILWFDVVDYEEKTN